MINKENTKKDFDQTWEKIYGSGQMINKYPYTMVVSLCMNYFSNLNMEERKKIKILDLGCGTGNNTSFFAKEGFDVTGIDASKSAIEYASKRFEKDNLSARFKVMEFNQIDELEKGYYDLVLDREALYTMPLIQIKEIVKKVRYLLKNNGLLISFIYDIEHPAIYEKKLIKATEISNPEARVFAGTANATFVDINEINEIFKDYKIETIYSNKLIQVLGEGINSGTSEYITVARKND